MPRSKPDFFIAWTAFLLDAFVVFYRSNQFFYLVMPARLINLPAVVRCQVFEACLSKRSFSISSKVSGHENPLVSDTSLNNEHTQRVKE
jgi:hypothetical protein